MGASARITKKRKAIFLEKLAKTGNVSTSAEAAGISRQAIYAHQKVDPIFAADWRESIEIYVERLEAEADRRGKDGVPRLKYHNGKACGRYREYSDNLLMFRLKALAPEKYKERSATEHTGKDGGPIDFRGLTDEQIESRIVKLLGKAGAHDAS